ncbi:MAG: stimulus-sensing domain-containing protein [Pseudomonadota bacterium]
MSEAADPVGPRDAAANAAASVQSRAAAEAADDIGPRAPIRPRAPSRLTRRIVGFNLIGLGLLVMGVLLLNDFRTQLVELRIRALESQARMLAVAVAEAAQRPDGSLGIDVQRARRVLDRLMEPADARARLFDRAGRLMSDTRLLAGLNGSVETERLPADRFSSASEPVALLEEAWRILLESLRWLRWEREPNEPLGNVAQEDEVWAAVGGDVERRLRVNERNELIVSVAVPIESLGKIHGALLLSTRGGDIDAIVASERLSILQVFLVALAVSVVLSVLLANTIARPIERLAEAALDAERGQSRRRDATSSGGRVALPDMTQRRDEIGRLSGALTRMTEALYSRIEATESFAADVAHEIKNPLTSLRSAVETLRYARRDVDRERLLHVIESDVSRLDRLVTDISNASRLDAELVREEREDFDLSALLSSIADFNAPKAEARGARIVPRLPEAPLTIQGIEGRLAQVFVNLLDNAASFSPEGGEIRLLARETDEGVEVRVEDEGPGIPDENLASVFQRFYSERPDSEAFGHHSGLGLSISRQIVEAHGGAIRAENVGPAGVPRRGARFVVTLPV